MLVSTLIGMLLVFLLGIPGRIHRQLEARRLHHQLADAQQQIAALKARIPAPVMQPLADERRSREV
jgi:hypothetical protein